MLHRIEKMVVPTPVKSIVYGTPNSASGELKETYNLENFILDPRGRLITRPGFIPKTHFPLFKNPHSVYRIQKVWGETPLADTLLLFGLADVLIETEVTWSLKEGVENTLICRIKTPDGWNVAELQRCFFCTEQIVFYLTDNKEETSYVLQNRSYSEVGTKINTLQEIDGEYIVLEHAVPFEKMPEFKKVFPDEEEGEGEQIHLTVVNKVSITVSRLFYHRRLDVELTPLSFTNYDLPFLPYSFTQQARMYYDSLILATGTIPLISIKAVAKNEKLVLEGELQRENIPLLHTQNSIWNGNDFKNTDFRVDISEKKVTINYVPTKESALLMEGDKIVIESDGKKLEAVIEKVVSETEYFQDFGFKEYSYTTKEPMSVFNYLIEHPEWDENTEHYNGKPLFVENPLAREMDSRKDKGNYVALGDDYINKDNKNDVIVREVFNPEIEPHLTQDERWLLFYEAKPTWDYFKGQKVVFLSTDSDNHRVKSTTIPAGRRIVRKRVKSKVKSDDQVHNTLFLNINSEYFEEYFELEKHIQDNVFPPLVYPFKAQAFLIKEAPILSCILHYEGYLFGIGTANIKDVSAGTYYQKRTIMYRTTQAGHTDKWYNATQSSYYFEDLTEFFPQHDFPVVLEANQGYLYVFGTRFTQVWKPSLLPANSTLQDNIKLVEHKIFGKYITTFEIGVYSEEAVFLRDNFLYAINTNGLSLINPFTLNNIPEVVRQEKYTVVLNDFLKTRGLFIDVVKTEEGYLIKKRGSNVMLYLQEREKGNFFISCLKSNLFSEAIPIKQSKNKDCVMLLQKEDGNVYDYYFANSLDIGFDGEGQEIEYSWDFAAALKNGGVWQNMRVLLRLSGNNSTEMKAKLTLRSFENYHFWVERELILEKQSDALVSQQQGTDIIFPTDYNLFTNNARFYFENVYCKIKIATKYRFMVKDFMFLGGRTNGITKN